MWRISCEVHISHQTRGHYNCEGNFPFHSILIQKGTAHSFSDQHNHHKKESSESREESEGAIGPHCLLRVLMSFAGKVLDADFAGEISRVDLIPHADRPQDYAFELRNVRACV